MRIPTCNVPEDEAFSRSAYLRHALPDLLTIPLAVGAKSPIHVADVFPQPAKTIQRVDKDARDSGSRPAKERKTWNT